MGTFKVKDKTTGKVFTVKEKDSIPNAQFLGDTARTEAKIAGRTPQSIPALIGQEINLLRQNPLSPANYSAKAANELNLLNEFRARGEAAIANPAMEIQKGTPEKAFQSFLQGVSGKRLGEFGDIYRNYAYGDMPDWFVEPMAGGLGTGALLGVGKVLSKLNPKLHTDKWQKNQAVNMKAGIDKHTAKLNSQYDKLWKPHNDRVIDQSKVDSVLKDIPKRIKKQISGLSEGKMTVEKANRVRDAIDAEISQTNWAKLERGAKIPLSKKELIRLKYSFKNLALEEVPKRIKDKVLALDKQFEFIKKAGGKVNKMVYDANTKTYRTGPITSVMNSAKAGAEREMIKEVASKHPQSMEAYKNFQAFLRREALKRGAIKATPWVIGGGLGAGALRKMTGE